MRIPATEIRCVRDVLDELKEVYKKVARSSREQVIPKDSSGKIDTEFRSGLGIKLTRHLW